jgi:hypothetical protein
LVGSWRRPAKAGEVGSAVARAVARAVAPGERSVEQDVLRFVLAQRLE